MTCGWACCEKYGVEFTWDNWLIYMPRTASHETFVSYITAMIDHFCAVQVFCQAWQEPDQCVRNSWMRASWQKEHQAGECPRLPVVSCSTHPICLSGWAIQWESPSSSGAAQNSRENRTTPKESVFSKRYVYQLIDHNKTNEPCTLVGRLSWGWDARI